MKSVWFENRSVVFADVPEPVPAEDEALVEVSMAGICGTDIEIYNGYADFTGILGHEFIGVVRCCPAKPALVGKRVVADINFGCGACHTCLCHDSRHCRDRKVLGIRGKNGAFAEYCTIPITHLHVVPENVKTIWAVFAEPLAAALEITQQVHITHQTRIAVIGDGKLGILAALGLSRYSCRVHLFGRHDRKLAIAADQGVRTTQTAPQDFYGAEAMCFQPFDITVDATGHPDGVNQAIALTRPEGTVVVKTTVREKTGIDMAGLVVNEIALLGSRCGDLSLALRFLQFGWVDVMPLVDAVYPFSRFDAAFSRAMQKNVLKVIIAFSEDQSIVQ